MTIKQFPQLYGIATNGKIKTVIISVDKLSDSIHVLVTRHGYVGGILIDDRRIISSGKNIGKSNETTVLEQALSDAESKWKKKKDNNYTENKDGVPDTSEYSLLPMLAHNFNKREKSIKYPCIVQPKLDGMRCMVTQMPDGSIRYTSRKFKEWTTLSHLDEEIKIVFKRMQEYLHEKRTHVLDGEIYIHGSTLADISRRIKKDRGSKTQELEYYVYDIVHLSGNKKRDEIREAILQNDIKVVHVPSYIANSKADIKQYHDTFVQQGFEGVIIRNTQGKYLLEKRSTDLQKYKEFMDAEFEIIGTKSGEGREENAIVYICKVRNPIDPKKLTFDVRPRGSIEHRQKLMRDISCIGKQLTVRFQELSENNIPIFPVGIMVRED